MSGKTGLFAKLIAIGLGMICPDAAVVAKPNPIQDQAFDARILARRKLSLELLSKQDSLSKSAYWPNVNPAYFFANLRQNITDPDKIYQGLSTNFCGYSALTHLFVKYHPDLYLRHMLSLYRSGKTVVKKKTLAPSPAVRQVIGTFRNKGEFDVRDADQLWFMTLADCFKGYMNLLDENYKRGDENKIWAATNFSKFNRMLRMFTDAEVRTVGSDLLRPFTLNNYQLINSRLQKGLVLLYINNNHLYPHKFALVRLRIPTHFIVLYDMQERDGMVEIKYLDYGIKSEQLITKRRLRKLTFGVSTIVTIQ